MDQLYATLELRLWEYMIAKVFHFKAADDGESPLHWEIRSFGRGLKHYITHNINSPKMKTTKNWKKPNQTTNQMNKKPNS